MSAKTKTALKAESNSTFTTNGVRAITAASHRTFNDDLIDSLDVVKWGANDVQIKKEYVQTNITLTQALVQPTTFLMSKVKDSLLSNVLDLRLVFYTPYGGNFNEMNTTSNSPDIMPLRKTVNAVTYAGYLCFYPTEIKVISPKTLSVLINPTGAVLEITYIPAE